MPSSSARTGEPLSLARRPARLGRFAGRGIAPTRLELRAGHGVPRQPGDVMVESWVREALHPAQPGNRRPARPRRRGDLQRCAPASSPCRPTDWCGPTRISWPGCAARRRCPSARTASTSPCGWWMPYSPRNNRLTVCNQWTYQAGAVEKRFDVVFLVNGLPLVIGEAKTPTRSAVTWFDGAFQVNEIYEKQVPAMFVPNVFSFATEGKLFRYGSIRMPIDMWGPWRDAGEPAGRRSCSTCKPDGGEHAPARGGAGHPAELHAVRHGQEASAHQDHLPLPAVLHHQPDRRARGEGLSEEGPDLAFPGQRQVAAHGLRRAEAAAASEAGQPHGDHRGGPHRPRHADHRHVQRGRRAEHGRRGHAAGVADAARRRTCARCSSPPSTSSARPAAS